MFCGIVDHCGTLLEIQKNGNSILFHIRTQFSELSLGESIAVDGVCLTVTAVDDHGFECELSPETLQVTAAGNYLKGQRLNLERAMCFGDRIGGHFVTGHVDEVVAVSYRKDHGAFIEVQFSDFSQVGWAYLMPKGSVTVNGVSLTVNAVQNCYFSVMLIPHTLARTNLSALSCGQKVNVEWDYLGKLVGRQIQCQQGTFRGISLMDDKDIRGT